VVLPWLTWKRSSQPAVSAFTETRDYPAIGTIFAFGKVAVPSLILILAGKESTTLESENALLAFMMIYRENLDEGLQLLRKEAESRTGMARDRLRFAAERADRKWPVRTPPRGIDKNE